MNSTICAISTPPGNSGIGIVRLSGSKSFDIAKILIEKPANFNTFEPWKLNRIKLIDSDSSIIDDALAVKMKAPNSYTGEDMVEFQCHGNFEILKKVISLSKEHGAVLAEPGEFTKRAFLNGKIDLVQAESVALLIDAKSERALKDANKMLEGFLSKQINKILDELITIQASLEANIDFPEDENDYDNSAEIRDKLSLCFSKFIEIQRWLKTERPYLENLLISIVGDANSGKSTLFNQILEKQRAIVTKYPGTTRDVVSEKVLIYGLNIEFRDTAGIRNSQDPIEKLGIEKSEDAITQSDLILFVIDASQEMSKDQLLLYEKIKNLLHIKIYNKKDLLTKDKIKKDRLYISALNGDGIENLKNLIKEKFLNLSGFGDENKYSATERQTQAMNKAFLHFEKAIFYASQEDNFPGELVSAEIFDVRSELEKLVGKKYSEDLLDRIFENFCIGK
ncbi:MAG: tRNA uridine-5-carboxymethylaminomethyl(34) synthesis GTPase MnmE [Pseudomonadota bacterium]